MKSGFCRNLGVGLCISLFLLGFGAGLARAQDLPAAQKAFQSKDFDKVIGLLSPHIEKLNRAGLFLLAQAYSEKKNQGLAIKMYQSALALNPKDYEAKERIGLEYMKMNKVGEAKAALRESIEMNPKYEQAYLDMATIYEKSKNLYELQQLYEDLIGKVGRKPQYITRLCELTTLESQYSLANSYCTEGIHLDPREPKNRVYLATTKKETGDLPQATLLYAQAADSNAKSEFAQESAATFFASQKNFVKAYGYAKRATIADPTSQKAWQALATNAIEIQKYEEALGALQKACAINRSATIEVRHAIVALRQQKQDQWQPKFQALSESCGPN